MTMNQKINECGWFYHAPAKRKEVTEPVQIPITSQIPGLSDLPPEFDDKPREMYFKDTDTKYIRLAKQGGRKDLLMFKDYTPKRHEPRGYPRVDWFYLEDNAAEDAAKKEHVDWQFLLPEYMVHEQLQPHEVHNVNSEVHEKKRRAPYAFDSTTVFEREGDAITDKTVKLPELRPHGYGVRINKPLQTKKQGPRDRAQKLPNSSQAQGDKQSKRKSALKSQFTSQERPAMEKLLSYAYDKEWHSKQSKAPVIPCTLDGMSEYTENFRKQSAGSHRSRRDCDGETTDQVHTSDKGTRGKQPHSVSEKGDKHPSIEEKEPFKLSKFKNVPARVDSHQKPDTHRSTQKIQD